MGGVLHEQALETFETKKLRVDDLSLQLAIKSSSIQRMFPRSWSFLSWELLMMTGDSHRTEAISSALVLEMQNYRAWGLPLWSDFWGDS